MQNVIGARANRIRLPSLSLLNWSVFRSAGSIATFSTIVFWRAGSLWGTRIVRGPTWRSPANVSAIVDRIGGYPKRSAARFIERSLRVFFQFDNTSGCNGHY
jgi:hypothetical protein